jgi:hypothetical protein
VIKTLCPIFSGWRAAWIKGMSSWIFSLSLCLSEKKTQLFRIEKCCGKRGQKDTSFHNSSNCNIFIVHIHKLFTVGCTVHVSLYDSNPL